MSHYRNSSLEKHRLYALQGLRALAAGIVIFVHALSTYQEKIHDFSLPLNLNGVGEFGVKLFFCISGFIIFNSARNLVPGLQSAAIFFRRRIIRIVPIYWLATTVYALKLSIQGEAPTVSDYVSSLLFIPYANEHGLMRPVLGVGWSLNYEMFFYLVFGSALFFHKNARGAIVFATILALYAAHNAGYFLNAADWLRGCLQLLTDYYLLYFIGGLCVGIIREKLSNSRHQLPFKAGTALTAAIAVPALYLMIHATNTLPTSYDEYAAYISCLLAISICGLESTSPDNVKNGLALRTMEIAGDASYSVYLTHGFVMGPIARMLHKVNIDTDPIIFASMMVLLCTAAGIAVYRKIEYPITAALNSLPWGARPSRTSNASV